MCGKKRKKSDSSVKPSKKGEKKEDDREEEHNDSVINQTDYDDPQDSEEHNDDKGHHHHHHHREEGEEPPVDDPANGSSADRQNGRPERRNGRRDQNPRQNGRPARRPVRSVSDGEAQQARQRGDAPRSRNRYSGSEQITNEIAAITSSRKDALKRVLVTDYKKYSAAGVFGADSADDARLRQLGFLQDGGGGAPARQGNGGRRGNAQGNGGGNGAVPGNDLQSNDGGNGAAPGNVAQGNDGAPAPGNDGGGNGNNDAPAAAAGSGKHLKRFNFWAGVIADGISLASATGNTVLADKEKDLSDTTDKNGKSIYDSDGKKIGTSERDEAKEEHKGARMSHAAFSMASQGLGAINSGVSYYLNKQNAESHNKRKRKAAKRGMFTSALGVGTNLSKIISTGITGFGDTKNVHQSRTVDAFNSIASILSITSATTGFIGNIADIKRRQKVIDQAEIYSNVDDDHDTHENRIKDSRQLVKWRGTDDQRLNSKKNYDTFKAKKYALSQAAEFNKIKKKTYFKGFSGFLGSLAGGVSTLTRIIDPDFAGSGTGTLVSSALGVFGSGMGLIEKIGSKITDKAIESKTEDKKIEIIEKYLEKKRDKIRDQAARAFRYHQGRYGEDITDNEADRIILGRLGIDTDINDTPVDKTEKQEAFEKLNMKRAKNIWNSRDSDKDQMLTALGLDKHASLKDVADALKGD